jgi:hypothetical protein
MTPTRPHRLTAVPQTSPVRLEILKAINALAAQCEDERARRRSAEIAVVRKDLDDIEQLLRQACREAAMDVRLYLRKYSPSQPRVPAGSPDGGQWTTDEGSPARASVTSSGNSGDVTGRRATQYAASDTGTRADARGGALFSVSGASDGSAEPAWCEDGPARPRATLDWPMTRATR